MRDQKEDCAAEASQSQSDSWQGLPERPAAPPTLLTEQRSCEPLARRATGVRHRSHCAGQPRYGHCQLVSAGILTKTAMGLFLTRDIALCWSFRGTKVGGYLGDSLGPQLAAGKDESAR